MSMPDTAENQDVYPQHGAQKEGLGFPIARIVVLLSLATAMASDIALGPYQGKETGETSLFRELLERLDRGDIVLADRYYCSYFMICLLIELNVDFVVRLHQKRTADFRRGQRLGKGDHLVVWAKAITWWFGCVHHVPTGWMWKPISACQKRSRCARSRCRSASRASALSRWWW